MPKIDLLQGSEEWLTWRRSKITATDASYIVGTNTYMTKRELWEEKLLLRPPKEINDAMRRGQDLEHEARELFIQQTGIKVSPCVYQSPDYEWMGASLDGLSECEKVITEIKCPGHKTHQEALDGIIKEYYGSQMDHQRCCVPKSEIMFYVSYRPEHEMKIHITDYESDKNMQESMIKLEQEFWIQLCTMQPPPEPWKLKEKK